MQEEARDTLEGSVSTQDVEPFQWRLLFHQQLLGIRFRQFSHVSIKKSREKGGNDLTGTISREQAAKLF